MLEIYPDSVREYSGGHHEIIYDKLVVVVGAFEIIAKVNRNAIYYNSE